MREEELFSFLSEVEKQKKDEDQLKKMKETPNQKIKKIEAVKSDAREICLDTLFAKLYKDAVPIDDLEKDACEDLDAEIRDFIHSKRPSGTSFYVKEAIKKGSGPAKILCESVDKFLNNYFSRFVFNINEVSSDDIVFDVKDPEVEQELETISSEMSFDELSEAIKNNVKIAANNEIKRVKEERQKIVDLEKELKEDDTVTSEAAIDLAKMNAGIKSVTKKIYEPELFQGIMINKLNLIKESACELDDETANKLAFLESVKEYTKLSILDAFMMESMAPKVKRSLANQYATMKIKGEIPMLREDRIAQYQMLTEGGNLNSRSYFIEFKKEYSENTKEAKRALKEKKFKQAIALCKKNEKLANDYYKKISDEESTVGSFAFGFFLTGAIPFLLRNIISMLLSIPTFGLSNYVNSITTLVERINVIIKDLKDRPFDATEDLNFYKNGLKARMKEYQYFNNMLIKKIEQAEEESKK